MNHLDRSLSKENRMGKAKSKRGNRHHIKVDKTTGASSGWNFYDQFSGTMPKGDTSALLPPSDPVSDDEFKF
jgi:hypothetical protein|tara:strand:+ start:1030 stop:1245 length:216 start_codon:yes stop_codon:yes gene_type:complete